MKQGISEKWKTEDVEVALEICRREYNTRLAEHRFRNATPGEDIETRNRRASEFNSANEETVPLTDTAHDSNTAPGYNQDEGNDGDDIDMIFDAYLNDDSIFESVTDGVASMYE